MTVISAALHTYYIHNIIDNYIIIWQDIAAAYFIQSHTYIYCIYIYTIGFPLRFNNMQQLHMESLPR